jgi:Regulator of chromosome condensation (RCC1) repeat
MRAHPATPLRPRVAMWLAAMLLGCVAPQDLGAARRCDDAAPCAVLDVAVERCASPNETRACYAGPVETRATGRCRDGVVRCDPLRGRFVGACEGEERPAGVELCANAIDDDCDGAVDEDCAAPRFTHVAVGDRTSCALAQTSEGPRLLCWGDGAWGLFGASRASNARPVVIDAPAEVQGLVMGASHVCLIARGEVWCLGRNASGVLGDGTTGARAGFVRVEGPRDVVELASGRFHVCARTRDGAVWCWGADDAGQTGAGPLAGIPCAQGGSRGCQSRAHAVTLPAPAEAITAGFTHTCARVGGDAWCWGASGAYRGGTAVAVATAERVLDGITDVVAGGDSTCVLRASVAECHGRLGGLREALVAGPSVVAGGARWCVAAARGSLRCTDDPWWTSLAPPAATTDPPRLTELANTAEPLRAMAIGISHACALWGLRTVRCWGGDNAYGELGVGTAVTWTEPLVDVRW